MVVITEGKRHDVRVARTLRFDPGTIVVMDRGYVDYTWLGSCRPRPCTGWSSGAGFRERGTVLRDEIIELTRVDAAMNVPSGCAGSLRGDVSYARVTPSAGPNNRVSNWIRKRRLPERARYKYEVFA